MEVCNEKEEKYFVWINIGIGEEMGYFRNKLNRIPKNIYVFKEEKRQLGAVKSRQFYLPYVSYRFFRKRDI